MRIGLACGGTGGHIFPGLATAQELQRRGHDVTLWLAGKDVESQAVEGWTGKVITVRAEGFPNRFSLRGLRTGWRLYRAYAMCYRTMKTNPPDAFLAMGSYASVGPVFAALRLHVPVVLHEANAIPGRAVSLLARWARCTAVSFEESLYHLRRHTAVITGMPLRREVEAGVSGQPFDELDPEVFTVLIMGGSRGALRLNQLASQAVCRVASAGKKIQVIHLAGQGMDREYEEKYRAAGVRALVFAFTHDMTRVYASTDLAICRSGGSTCAELCLHGIPSLLVPYPFAAADHQTRNAEAMQRVDAAHVAHEKNLTQEWLMEYLLNCMESPDRLRKIAVAARKISRGNGTARLADLVEKIVRGEKPDETIS